MDTQGLVATQIPPQTTHPFTIMAAPSAPSSAQDAHVDTYRLGTRNSQLALVQTHHVAALLNGLHPGDALQFPVTPMSVLGDRNKTSPLYLLSGDNQVAGIGPMGETIAGAKAGAAPAKSLWTEELEVALMRGELDMIIHCLKDMPTRIPDDCEIAAILPREDPHDALVVKKGLHYKSLAELPEGSVVGTSSVRRIAQLRRVYPKLKVMDVVSPPNASGNPRRKLTPRPTRQRGNLQVRSFAFPATS